MMNDRQRKAMWAKVNADRSKEHDALKQMMDAGDAERLKQRFGSYLKKDIYYDRNRLEKFRGKDRSLRTAILTNDFMDKNHVWTFHKGIAIHPTDNDAVWDMYPLMKRRTDEITNSHDVKIKLEKPITEYFVNDTKLDGVVLGEIARYAKQHGLLQKGTVPELAMKAKFEATEYNHNKPVAIKLGHNTFFIAPVAY